MNRYDVFVSKSAFNFLEKIDEEKRGRILKEIADLENFLFFSIQHDMAKIKGEKNLYRLRIGNIRIIFRVDKVARKIYVETISQRKSAYK